MRSYLAVVMVVFKCLLLFIFVFYIQVTHCKPVNDEKAEVSGIGSTLWGWVTYVIPWGSADTSDTAIPQQNNSKQIKNEPVLEARKFTAATIPVNPATAKVSTLSISDKRMGLEVTNIRNSVRIMSTTEPMVKQLLESKAASTVPASNQNKLSWEIIAVEYSPEPTALNAQVHYNPTTTEESTTQLHFEIEMPTTHTLSVQDNFTEIASTEEPKIDLITLAAWDVENPTTTEEHAKEQPLEFEALTHVSVQNTSKITEEITTDLFRLETTTTFVVMDENIPITQETVTEQIFKPEVTTMSIVMDTDYPTKVEESVEPEVSNHLLTLYTTSTSILIEEPAIDHLLPALPTSNIAMDSDFTISTIVLGTEPPSTSTSPMNNPATEIDNPFVLQTSTLSIDENSTITTVEIALEQSLELEAATTEEHLLELQLPTKASSTLTIGDELEFSGQQYKTPIEKDALVPTQHTFPSLEEHKVSKVTSKRVDAVSNSTEFGTGSYKVVDESSERFNVVDEVGISTARATDAYITLHEEMFIPFEAVSIVTESVTDLYANLDETILKPVEVSTNAHAEVNHAIFKPVDPPIFPEPITVMYPEVTVAHPRVSLVVSEINEDSPERNEVSKTTASATRSYLGVDVVSEIEEVILADLVTKREDVSVSTEFALYQLLEVNETMPMEVNNMPIELNAVLKAANEVMPTENDERIAATRFSRSHSAGSRLCFVHMRFVFITFYILRTIFYESLE